MRLRNVGVEQQTWVPSILLGGGSNPLSDKNSSWKNFHAQSRRQSLEIPLEKVNNMASFQCHLHQPGFQTKQKQKQTMFSLEICFVLKSGDGRYVQEQGSLLAVAVGRPRGSKIKLTTALAKWKWQYFKERTFRFRLCIAFRSLEWILCRWWMIFGNGNFKRIWVRG